MYLAGKEDTSRVCYLLQTGRDVHPISENITVLFNDDVAQVDPNA